MSRLLPSVALCALTVALLSMPSSAVRAADDEDDGGAKTIGSAIHVENLVTAELSRDTRSLRVADDVHQHELIEVSSDGHGEFQFLDETKIALGANAKLTLDKFVYDPDDKKGGKIVVNMAKGAFRWITGVASKPTYTIKTPTASITVRGTIFDVYVEKDGTSWLLLHEGAVRACATGGGGCRDHSEPGKLIRIGGGKVSAPTRWASLSGTDDLDFDDAFPFVADPPSLDPDPIHKRTDILGSGEGKSPKKSEPEKEQEEEEAKPEKTKQASTTYDDDQEAAPVKRPSKKATTYEPKRPSTRVVRGGDDDDEGYRTRRYPRGQYTQRFRQRDYGDSDNYRGRSRAGEFVKGAAKAAIIGGAVLGLGLMLRGRGGGY